MKILNRPSLGIVSAIVLAAASPVARAQIGGGGHSYQYQFDFGNSTAIPWGLPVAGWTQITPTNIYSTATGYGFEPGTLPVAVGKDALGGDQPFYFSIAEPEGNYKITVTFGSAIAPSDNTVKAELRRLMLEKVHTDAGKTETRSFIVNLRTPTISTGGNVKLKAPRETTEEWRAWDDKLTLEFNGVHPSLRSLQIEKVDVPTVYILGDSTVCDQPAEPWNSWGQMLPRFFKPEVAIANHAESGETVADSLSRQRFEKIFSLMKKGDYLLVQFGTNDMKDKNPNAKETYQANLKKIIERTRSLGGTPVLITPMERKAGVKAPTLNGYPDLVREVAKSENCALIDLNEMSVVFYKALGEDLGKAFALTDGTHHNNYGSYELAQCIVEGIKQDKLPLADFIAADFKDFDPAKPDALATFTMAASPTASAEKPLGN